MNPKQDLFSPKTLKTGLILISTSLLISACGGQKQFSAKDVINNTDILVDGRNDLYDPPPASTNEEPIEKDHEQVEDESAEVPESNEPENYYADASKRYPYSEYKMTPLSWTSQKYPERAKWSKFLQEIIVSDWSGLLNGAEDMDKLCPRYSKLSVPQKANVWAELFVGMSWFESNYSPVKRMHETNMGIDPVTKKPVYSEGLLQLSYQDVQWARYCRFSWDLDKNLEPKDPRKTILNPYNNLYCAVGIMNNQIHRRKKIILTSGVYWAVLKADGKYRKVKEITERLNSFPLCK